MLFSKLANLYEEIGTTPKRLEKMSILAKFLQLIPKDEYEVLYLLMGNIYPQYDERKIGISDKLTIKAIAKTSGVSSEEISKEWRKIGDIGQVAEKLMKNKKQSTLNSQIITVEKVLSNLRKLPELEGNGTVDKKMYLIAELLSSSSGIEAKYITRLLIGDLRIGLKESTIRSAIAEAFFSREPEIEKKIQSAIDQTNDVGLIFQLSQSKNIKAFDKISLKIGKAIKVMLAQKAKNIEEGFERVGKPAAIEYKYDGFRLAIHKKDNKITLFTRRLENVTKQFPEVVEYINKFTKGKEFILDGEAVGFDSKTKIYLPFQSISQRIRRKYDIEKVQKQFPVEINIFDILYYENKNYIEEPFEKRRALLNKIITEVPFKIRKAKQIITENPEEAEKFYHEALDNNQEGIMMKSLDKPYQPGNRVGHMIKVKPEQRDFDLVITGAEYGTGKRSGWLSSFILSCRNKNEFLEIGKMGTGIKEKSEEEVGGISFEKLTELLKPLVTEEKGREVKISPKIVIAITYQEIQKSPNYSSGFALRFPRLTALRPDKPLSEIVTLEEIKKEYEKQGG